MSYLLNMFCVVSVEDVQFGFIRNVPNVIEICHDKQLWNFYGSLEFCVCVQDLHVVIMYSLNSNAGT